MTVHRNAFLVKPAPWVGKFILLALVGVLATVGLTGCKCCCKKSAKAEHPAQTEPSKSAEHPEHPK